MTSRMAGSFDERRMTIARATCCAIIERGLHRMNMRDIARVLGTTTGPLQHYFTSKEELLLFTKNLLIDEMLAQARQAADQLHGRERLRVVCEQLLPYNESARMAWLVLTAFNGRAIGDRRLTAVQRLRYSRCREFFEQEITLAKDSGEVDASVDTALEAMALASFVDGLAVQLLFCGRAATKRAKEQLVVRYLERSFGPGPDKLRSARMTRQGARGQRALTAVPAVKRDVA